MADAVNTALIPVTAFGVRPRVEREGGEHAAELAVHEPRVGRGALGALLRGGEPAQGGREGLRRRHGRPHAGRRSCTPPCGGRPGAGRPSGVPCGRTGGHGCPVAPAEDATGAGPRRDRRVRRPLGRDSGTRGRRAGARAARSRRRRRPSRSRSASSRARLPSGAPPAGRPRRRHAARRRRRRRAKYRPASAEDLAVEVDVEGDHGRAGAHGPQQRRVGAADRVPVQVGAAVARRAGRAAPGPRHRRGSGPGRRRARAPARCTRRSRAPSRRRRAACVAPLRR